MPVSCIYLAILQKHLRKASVNFKNAVLGSAIRLETITSLKTASSVSHCKCYLADCFFKTFYGCRDWLGSLRLYNSVGLDCMDCVCYAEDWYVCSFMNFVDSHVDSETSTRLIEVNFCAVL